MKKVSLGLFDETLMILITIALIAIDFLIFHDFLKVGETYTFTDCLIGITSVLIFFIFVRIFIKNRK